MKWVHCTGALRQDFSAFGATALVDHVSVGVLRTAIPSAAVGMLGGAESHNVSQNVSGQSSDPFKPPPGIVTGIACHLGLTGDEAYALLTDPVRAPSIMATVRERFNLSDRDDTDEPGEIQLGQGGWLTEIEAQWFDGVVDAHE